MKVGTRITAATSALVATALALYGLWEVGSTAREQRHELVEEAGRIARSVVAAIERRGLDQVVAQADLISGIHPDWLVAVYTAPLATSQGERDTDADADARLRALMDARPARLVSEEDDRLVYALPIRVPDRVDPEGYRVVGSVEVARSLAHLEGTWREELVSTLPLLGIIVGLVVVAVMLLTRTVVTGPIQKLLDGIDDVAKGDLSRVLLSEREDEIGALASRFNDMTHSLRESRGETERQNEARLKLEARLLKSEKLATIGQLAAEIAHEVGTPLNVIAGRARTLARKSADADAVAKNAHIIAEQASRITRIIQRLLDFARRKVGTVEAEQVDLNQVCRATMDFLEGRLTAARVEPILELDPELPGIDGYADQLQQVLLNLLLNGIEAMGQGGRLEVRTRTVTRRRPGLEVAPEQLTAVVEIRDTGVGIPEDLRERIFEPFYTSKDREGGTGLGLAVSSGIIKDHDGWIEVDDGPGGGTLFRVFLPVTGA